MIDLYRLFRPRFWVMNEPYSAMWDEFVLRAISTGDIQAPDSPYSCVAGGKRVWIGNYPYSYAVPYDGTSTSKCRPSARTIDLFRDAVILAGVTK